MKRAFIQITVFLFLPLFCFQALEAQQPGDSARSLVEYFPAQHPSTWALLSPSELEAIFLRDENDPLRRRMEEQIETFARPLLHRMSEMEEDPVHPVRWIERALSDWDPAFRKSFLRREIDTFRFQDVWDREVSHWDRKQKVLALHFAFMAVLNDAAESDDPIERIWHQELVESVERAPERILGLAQVSTSYALMISHEIDQELKTLRGQNSDARMEKLHLLMAQRPGLFKDSTLAWLRLQDLLREEGEDYELEDLAFLQALFLLERKHHPDLRENPVERSFGAEAVFYSAPGERSSERFGVLTEDEKQLLSESRLALAHAAYEQASREEARSLKNWGLNLGTPIAMLGSGLLMRHFTRAHAFDWGSPRKRARILRDLMKTKPSGMTRQQLLSLSRETSSSSLSAELRRNFPQAREDFRQQIHFLRNQNDTEKRFLQYAESKFGSDFAQDLQGVLNDHYEAEEARLNGQQSLCGDLLAKASAGGQRMSRVRRQVENRLVDQGSEFLNRPSLADAVQARVQELYSPSRIQRSLPRGRFRGLSQRAAQISGQDGRSWFRPWARNPRLPQDGVWRSIHPGAGMARSLGSNVVRGLGRSFSNPFFVAGAFALGGGRQFYLMEGQSHRLPLGQEESTDNSLWAQIRADQPQLEEVVSASIAQLQREWQGSEGLESEMERRINQERRARGLEPLELIVDPRSVYLGSDGKLNQETGRVNSVFVWARPKLSKEEERNLEARVRQLRSSFLIAMVSHWEDEGTGDAKEAGEVSWRFGGIAPLYRPGNDSYNQRAAEVFSWSLEAPDPAKAARLFNPRDLFSY